MDTGQFLVHSMLIRVALLNLLSLDVFSGVASKLSKMLWMPGPKTRYALYCVLFCLGVGGVDRNGDSAMYAGLTASFTGLAEMNCARYRLI